MNKALAKVMYRQGAEERQNRQSRGSMAVKNEPLSHTNKHETRKRGAGKGLFVMFRVVDREAGFR